MVEQCSNRIKMILKALATPDARNKWSEQVSLAKVPIDKRYHHRASNPGSDINTQNHLPERVAIWAEYRDDIRIDPNTRDAKIASSGQRKGRSKKRLSQCLAELLVYQRRNRSRSTGYFGAIPKRKFDRKKDLQNWGRHQSNYSEAF